MAQLVEHVLGKDEVPGSNPGISSKRKRIPCGFFFFLRRLPATKTLSTLGERVRGRNSDQGKRSFLLSR